MAKKKKQIKETTIEDFYDLKVDKMDELVAALKGEDPPDGNDLSMYVTDCTGVDEKDAYTKGGKRKQFDPYKIDFLGRIPTWIKALFVKWWFAGAVCYFVMFGLQNFIGDPLDLIVFTGIILGMIVEILVNPLFRYMERGDGEYDPYIMFPFPFKAYWTFFTNILYYVVVAACVNGMYLGMNLLFNSLSGTENITGVEPLLFGTFCVIADMAFIGIKDLIVYLVKRSKKENTADV